MKSFALLCVFLFLGMCQAHLRMNSPTPVRNGGSYDATARSYCGFGNDNDDVVGANGYITTYQAGQAVELVWEMNAHPARTPGFRVAFSPNGQNAQFAQNIIIQDIPHNGAGVYRATVTLPNVDCSAGCSMQVYNMNYEWGACSDFRYAFSQDLADQQAAANSSGGGGMNGAEKFFLAVFIIGLILGCAVLALVVARRTGQLEKASPALANAVESGENKTADLFRKLKDKASGSNSHQPAPMTGVESHDTPSVGLTNTQHAATAAPPLPSRAGAPPRATPAPPPRPPKN